jgi:hypothetical protein
VVTRLRRGLPPQLTETAIDTLVKLQRPCAVPALLELTQHRRSQLRIKAIQALSDLKARSAQSALLYALDDPSPEVRSAAVSALASLGNARALPALFAAADRGVAGAWQAIGNLAGAGDFKRLWDRAQAGDVTVLRPALDAIMARSNLPTSAKVRVVHDLEKLGSPSARVCLVEWVASFKTEAVPPIRQALFDSIKRLDSDTAQAAAKDETTKPAAKSAATMESPARSGRSNPVPGKELGRAPAKAPAANPATPVLAEAANGGRAVAP